MPQSTVHWKYSVNTLHSFAGVSCDCAIGDNHHRSAKPPRQINPNSLSQRLKTAFRAFKGVQK